MAEPTCETCRFWVDQRRRPDDEMGECHRRAPVASSPFLYFIARAVSDEDSFGGIPNEWPITTFFDWCGEHQPAKTHGGEG